MQSRQTHRIREIGDALTRAGFHGLDTKAQALGLQRSTAWTILRGTHKTSGLSAKIVLRMLASPRLPPGVRGAILVYADEKIAGVFGHGQRERRLFADRLNGHVHQ